MDPVGRLPTVLRDAITFMGLHDGDEGPSAGAGRTFFYAGRTTDLLAFDHLEESLFHEAVHLAFGPAHDGSDGWRAAQASDGEFLTGYAAASPGNEDLAETTLFAFGLLHHPGRIPPADATDIESLVPARIAYVATLLPPGEPLTRQVSPVPDCPG